MLKYRIGDVIKPKYKRHSHWENRVIVGYDGDIGYLWSYIENEEVFTSLNSSDPELSSYWAIVESEKNKKNDEYTSY